MDNNGEPQIFKKRYKVEKKLGSGNFGTAYLVTDIKAKNEPKVLKVVRLGEMDSEQQVDSVNEAKLLSNLQHEHIVKFHESFSENDCLCIVTEYCEGGDLDNRLKELKKQKSSLDEDQVVEWLIQILMAVHYIHKSKVLHRDLKARNIFLKSNQVKIGDFGISRVLLGTMDVANTFTGTPYYMSPEVLKHNGYTSKSDIWSVGCLLYEMCTGQHAFDGSGLMNVIYKVVEGKAPELPTKYSKELDNIRKRMLVKDPDQRPTAAELLETKFIKTHRERVHLNGALENTIAGNARSRHINDQLQTPIFFGQMKGESWTISGTDHIPDNDDDDQDENNATKRFEEVPEDDDEEERTLKQVHTRAPASHKTTDRKVPAPGAYEQASKQPSRPTGPVRPSADEGRVAVGIVKQVNPHADYSEEYRQEVDVRNRNPGQNSQESKFNTVKPKNAPPASNIDDRPLSPMRGTYKDLAEQYKQESDQSYDDNSFNDRNPPRDQQKDDRLLQTKRVMSGSQRRANNSLSQTIDPRMQRRRAEPEVQPNPAARTIGSATRRKPAITTYSDEGITTLKDNPRQDAFGPIVKNAKVNELRTRAIRMLGESTFEKVYDYIVQQRAAQKVDPNFSEAKMTEGLRAFVSKPGDCFIVDQLVFLES